jgi:hypothetical protein
MLAIEANSQLWIAVRNTPLHQQSGRERSRLFSTPSDAVL